jgi:hypothetical protein
MCSLGRHGDRWEDNIKNDLKEVVLEDTAWIDLTQDRNR